MTPDISVIVPVYGVERYLRTCLDSILGQDFARFELILVDDGSPDGCGAICDEYAARDGRVRVIHQENRGLAGARNRGTAAASAGYITFVDADDHVAPDHLSALWSAMTARHGDMAVAPLRREYVRADGSVRYRDMPSRPPQVMDRDSALEELCFEQYFGGFACGPLVRRAQALASPFPEGRLFEDSFTVYRWVMACGTVVYSPKATYFYLQRPGSIQKHAFEPRHMDLIDAVAEMMDAFRAAGMPPAVLDAGSYKTCRACYVTAFHAADLDRAGYRSLLPQIVPLLREHWPAARRTGRLSAKEKFLFRLLMKSPDAFYQLVKLKK